MSTLGTFSSIGKSVTGAGSQVSDIIRRQQIGGNIGGSIYGLVWGELSNILNTVLGINVSNTTPTFNERMYGYMFRLMAINKFEKDLTLATIAQGAYINGDGDGLPLSAIFPLYANIVSDYPAFVRGAAANENNGVDSTRSTDKRTLEVTNLYPDDLGLGTFENTWNLDNRNSLLTKTKKLFEKGKINSLISRFGTNADGEGDIDFNGKVGYPGLGMSRGKNLRRAGAQGENYDVNGYNNPYCRVWTHHSQYDNYSKVIRPFTSNSLHTFQSPAGNLYAVLPDDKQVTMRKIHTWNNEDFKFNEGEDGEWGWKNENSEWSHSVLNQQTLVNIAPKYDDKGTIHTKDCMFSIENLAWKDYDPYSFENALSWEQRGPLGGRIMWFPPYGISFTENTSVAWNESTFIGRGENVYTYSNTTRSGTLSFMMLTDHPSIVDYASWHDGSNEIDDDTWNRFFAGCDSLDSNDTNSLMHYLKPTPMDYVFETKTDTVQEKVDKSIQEEENTPSDSVNEVKFFVFFPNNYSGLTDDADFAIAYLLGGVNAQKLNNSRNDDLISFTYSPSSKFIRGYEMNVGLGVTDERENGNRIVGCKGNWRIQNVTEYQEDLNKLWFYRIDGKYEVPTNNEEKLDNCYSQVLHSVNSYKDTTSYGFNLSVENIPTDLCKDKDNLFSFAEFAYAVSQYVENANGVSEYLKNKIPQSRVDKINDLVGLFKNELESVEITGYANSQGYNNDRLSRHRGNTIANWLRKCFGYIPTVNIGNDVKGVSGKDEWTKEAKTYRCVKCTLRFGNDVSTPNNKDNEEFDNVDSTTLENIEKETNTPYSALQNALQSTGVLDNAVKPAYDNLMGTAPRQENKEGKLSGVNKIRYDNEMFFYKKFKETNPFKFKALSEKLQYFDPAFHSMTPEGFNMRLTFLQQCTRQGDTMSASDINAGTRVANNMAFGRPPFCVLRLGDFYNQMIVIKSINIVYDEDGALTWDLNDEGIGAQPMIARVTISFDFIGGGDLAGPVRRLQNAMSFNYYANASLYDNRADRMYYDAEENLSTKMGGAGNDKPSLPEVDEEGNIISKKGTYSVLHSVAKDDTEMLAKAAQTVENTFRRLPQTTSAFYSQI